MKTYFTTPSQSSTKATFKIVIIYFIISILWIFFSDTLIGRLNLSLSTQTTVSIIKGWGFVIITSILLYYLIKKSTGHIFDDYNLFSKNMGTVPVGIAFVSKEGQITFANNNAEKILGLKKELITSRTYNAADWKITSFDGSLFPAEQLPFSIVQRTGNAVNNIEHAIEYVSGRRTLLSINAAPIKDRNNNFDGMISVIEDITDRKRAEAEILKLNRVYAVISQINQAIVHLREKDKLLSEACRVAIEFGKFQMAWIGLVDEETKLVNQVSFAGIEDGYLSKIKKISISDVAEGRGPTGTAIREGRHFVCDDIENDPRMAPWKDEALKRGYRSSIALPIKLFGKVIGAFSLYSSVPHFFDQKEIDLLDEVTGDLTFALEAIEVGEKRKETEHTLIDSEKRYRELFMSHPHPMWIYEVETLKIIDVNESAINSYGYTKDEFTTLTLKDIRPEEDVPLLLNNVKTHNESIQRERTFRHKKKDDTIIHVEISSHNLPPLEDKNYRIVMAIDITEQFKAEEALHESEIKFRNVFENSVDAIGVSKSGIHVFVNPAYLTLFGYANSNELTGKPIIDLIAPSEHTKILDNVKRREIGELSLSCYETRGLRKDGSEFDMDVHVSRYELNNETYTLVILRDITERKHAEEMLHRNEEVLRLFVEHSPASIAMFDCEMKYIVASHRYLIDYDLGEQNVVGRSHYEIFPEIPERWKEIHKRCLSGSSEKCDEDLFPRASGKVDWVRWEIRPWYELQGKIGGIILFSEVITERKRAEEKLLKSEHMLSESQRMGNIGGWSWDLSGPIKWTDETYNLYGVSPKTFTPTVESLINLIHPVDRSTMQQWIEDCAAGKKSDELVFRTLLPDGSIRFLNGRGELIYDAKNKTKLIYGTVQDITERKKAEEEINKSRDELRSLTAHLQTVREEERTNLAREMHDEVGQILTSIKMNLSLMRRQVEDKEKKFHAKELDEEIQSMSKMVDHAVVRVRKMITELRPELLDKLGLIPALEWYVEEYEKETKIKSEFRCDFEELSLDHNVELTIFRIIQEALTNVLKHASAKHVSIDVKKMRDHILVEVFDDGKGITEEEMKEKKSFGLLGMRERANLVGGEIEISGIAGKGTTVRLFIRDF